MYFNWRLRQQGHQIDQIPFVSLVADAADITGPLVSAYRHSPGTWELPQPPSPISRRQIPSSGLPVLSCISIVAFP